MSKKKIEEIECGVFYGKPLIFRPKSHRYFFGGEPIPSVTTILGRMDKGEFLKAWVGKVAVEMAASLAEELPDGRLAIKPEQLERCQKAYSVIRDEAGDVGRFLHSYAEHTLKGERAPLPTTEAEKNGVRAFEDWMKQNKLAPIALEQRVVSQAYFYAGTTDFFGRVNGRLAILDFKSGKYIYDEAWFQAEAYGLALEEMRAQGAYHVPDYEMEPIVDKHIIRLSKETGEFEHRCRPMDPRECAPFLHLLALDKSMRVWNSLKSSEKKQAKLELENAA